MLSPLNQAASPSVKPVVVRDRPWHGQVGDTKRRCFGPLLSMSLFLMLHITCVFLIYHSLFVPLSVSLAVCPSLSHPFLSISLLSFVVAGVVLLLMLVTLSVSLSVYACLRLSCLHLSSEKRTSAQNTRTPLKIKPPTMKEEEQEEETGEATMQGEGRMRKRRGGGKLWGRARR